MTPKIKLICSYNTCTAHQLHRKDWSAEQNQKTFGHCANIHGHQYRIELHLEGSVSTETGMIINAYDIDAIMKPFLDENFDHKFLNQDVPHFANLIPTAENIAIWMFDTLRNKFPKVVTLTKIKVYETPEVVVEYPCL